MLPPGWKLKLADLNVSDLCDDVLRRSDYVFLSWMIVHR